MDSRRIARVAAVAAILVGTTLSATGARADGEALSLTGLRTLDARRVSVVASTDPVTAVTPALRTQDVTLTVDGARVPVTAQPVLRDQISMAMVVDASAQAAEDAAGGGISGVASFMLEAPTNVTLSVVADQSPPVLAAAPAEGVSAALDAASKLQPGGDRSTNAAISLALQQDHPGILVLYTSAGSTTVAAAQLGARIQAAGAVLAVVTTSADRSYWSTAAERTGGLALSTTPQMAIQTFDHLSDALRTRSVLTFAAPKGATSVTVTADRPGGSAAATLALPASAPGSASTAGPSPSSSGSGLPGWARAVIVLLLIVALAGVILAVQVRRHRREAARQPTVLDSMAGSPEAKALASQVLARRPSPEPAVPPHRPRPAPLPNSWKFQVDEIKTEPDLFEPRASRDARAAIEHGDHPQLSAPLSERFEQIRRSLAEPPASSFDPAEDDDPAGQHDDPAGTTG